MSIQDYHYYEAKNQRDSKMLNFVFKITFDEDGNIIQKFNKKRMGANAPYSRLQLG